MTKYWDKGNKEAAAPVSNVLLKESQAHCQSPVTHSSHSSQSSQAAVDHPYLANIMRVLNELGFKVYILVSKSLLCHPLNASLIYR